MDKTNKLHLAIAIVFGIFMINLAAAEIETLGTFKLNECIELRQSCSNCTYVNITSVTYPDSSLAIGETEMTALGTNYNYTFCLANQIGEYIVNTKGDIDGIETVVAYDFYVTSTGSNKTSLLPIFLLIGGYILLVLALFNKEYILGFASGTLLCIGGVYLLIYGLGDFNNLYTNALGYVSLFLGIIVSFASIYEALPEGGEE